MKATLLIHKTTKLSTVKHIIFYHSSLLSALRHKYPAVLSTHRCACTLHVYRHTHTRTRTHTQTHAHMYTHSHTHSHTPSKYVTQVTHCHTHTVTHCRTPSHTINTVHTLSHTLLPCSIALTMFGAFLLRCFPFQAVLSISRRSMAV